MPLATFEPIAWAILRLVVIAALTAVTIRLTGSALRHAGRRLERAAVDAEQLARLRTLLQVGHGALRVTVVVAALLMVLQTVGINITPVLAGAGVVGLAISLGAQTLFKDYIGGILILTENQFTVGDTIKVAGVEGEVERILLRATYLRDADGQLHTVPNGEIRLVSNRTAEWSRAVVDLYVSYRADMSRVMSALECAARGTEEDEQVKAYLLERPRAQVWTGFKDLLVQVRLSARTAPGKQNEVSAALRRCALQKLEAEGIEIQKG